MPAPLDGLIEAIVINPSSILHLILSLFLVLIAGFAWAGPPPDVVGQGAKAVKGLSGVLPASSEEGNRFKVKEERTFGDYRIVIDADETDVTEHLKIFKKGLLLYIKEGHRFRIGLIYDDVPEDKLVQLGKDITGDGQPDMVVSDWSGGAHCCFTFDVFTIGDSFKHLATLDGGHGDGSLFEDVDKDGALEFVAQDWTFAYWNTCFALSPVPEVVLKWNGKEYVPSLALMEKPPLSEREYKPLVKAVDRERKSMLKETARQKKDKYFDYQNFGWYRDGVFMPPLAWEHLLWLIYTGHAPTAKDFLVRVWPAGKPGQELFWGEFMEKLADSPYCHGIRDHYGSQFPLVCNKQSADFGYAGFGEILKRGHYQEMIDEEAAGENAGTNAEREQKPCDAEAGDCS